MIKYLFYKNDRPDWSFIIVFSIVIFSALISFGFYCSKVAVAAETDIVIEG